MQTMLQNYGSFEWIERIPVINKFFGKHREQKIQKTIEEQIAKLEKQKAELERANLQLINQQYALNQFVKDDYSDELDDLSHELRTPLTAILGFAQLLLRNADKDTLTSRQRRGLERIATNAENMLAVINQLIDKVSTKAENKGQGADVRNIALS